MTKQARSTMVIIGHVRYGLKYRLLWVLQQVGKRGNEGAGYCSNWKECIRDISSSLGIFL